MTKLTCAVAITLLGCGTDGPETLPDLHVPAAPTNGIQVITPIFENIQPGTDNEVCTWTDAILTEQTDVKWTEAHQNEPPGHHAILFYTLEKQPPGTQRICTDTDMATFRYLTGNGGNGMPNEAPGDLVFRIPAGAQLVVNSHFLNASDEVVRGQSLVNVNFAEPGNHRAASSIAITDASLEVQPGVSTQVTSCTIDRQYKLWYLIPHMHRWGTQIKVDVTKGTTKMNMFDTMWAEQYTFHPPEKRFDLASPFVLDPGDKVDVTCTWNNDESHSLPFGFEMCVAFGQFVDENEIGSWACNKGVWDEL